MNISAKRLDKAEHPERWLPGIQAVNKCGVCLKEPFWLAYSVLYDVSAPFCADCLPRTQGYTHFALIRAVYPE